MSDDLQHWPLFEVFIRARAGLEHKHVGSLHAVDAKMALGTCTRRLYPENGGGEPLGGSLGGYRRIGSR